jgi:WD40 repeat protein
LLLVLAVGATITALRLKRESERTRQAKQVATEKMRAAYLAQARAERLSGVVGRRMKSLEAIVAATDVRPSLELRNEAIAALASLDLGPPRLWRRAGRTSLAESLLVSPRLDSFAVFSGMGVITVCRAPDGAEQARWTVPRQPVLQGRFSPDGRWLAAAFRGGAVSLCDLDQPGAPARTGFVPVDDLSHPLAFTPDGKSFLVTGRDRWLHFHDLATGEETDRLEVGVISYQLEFDPSGRILAVMAGRNVHLWDLPERRKRKTFTHAVGGTLLAWHPSGRLLAAGYDNGDLRLWDTETGEARPLPGHAQYICGLDFDPLGEFLSSQSWDGTAHFWSPGSGQPLFWMPHAGVLQSGRDGARVAFRNDDGSVGERTVLRSPIFQSLVSVHTSEPHLNGVDVSRDGHSLIFGMKSGWQCWDLAQHKTVAVVASDARASPLFHPGGRFVLTASPDRLLRWPLENSPASSGTVVGESEVLVSAPGSGFQRAALSPDGRLVAVAGHRQSLVLDWNEPTRIVHFARERAQSFVAIDPGNQWVAAASAVGFGVAIWDTRDGRLIRQLIAQDNARIAISPDGRTLATATPREWVWWDTDSWQPRRRVPLGLLGGVPAPVAFSPDGRLFAIAATRTDVDLLDAHTGEARATLTAPAPQNLNSLVFSGAGPYLAADTLARVVHLWDLRALRDELAVLKLDW